MWSRHLISNANYNTKWGIFIKNVVAVAAYIRLASRSQAKFHTKKLSPLVRPCTAAPAQSTTSAHRSLRFSPRKWTDASPITHWTSGLPRRYRRRRKKNSCVAIRRLASWSQADFGQVGYVWKAVFTSLSSRACERKWRKDQVTGRRQPNRSQSFRSVPISGAGMLTIAAVNSAVWMMVSHFALKTDPVLFVKTGCQKPGLHKPRLRHRRIVARPPRRRKQRRKQVRPWTILWRYTHQKTLCRLLPSVPSPKNRPRPSGRKQPQVPLNPSPWLPASRRWDGPAPTGRTTAGLGRLNVREDTARKNVRILRDISRHAVTATAATGERASGPGQVPLVVPACVDVPSPAVSLRRMTPVRRALPLAIIIILRAIVDPFHYCHHGRLQTASLSPVTTRDDQRVPIGRVRRTSPDGMSSCLLWSPRPLRSVRSRWLPRRPSRFMLNRSQKFQSRHR